MAAPPRVILVTGGSGLFGTAVREYARAHALPGESWVFASSSDADLRDAAATMALFARVAPTHVLHLAAFVGGLFSNMTRRVEFLRYNILMQDNVFEASRAHGVTKCVSCLSTCIFPAATPYPIDESMIHAGPPHPSNAPYAHAKRLVDVANRAYRDQFPDGCKFTAIIPTNVYGEHDNFSIADGHVVPGLIHKAYLAQRDGTDFVVAGSGTPLRQFIHALDLAELSAWVLREYDDVEPIILCPDEAEEVSIAQVAEWVREGMGLQAAPVFDRSLPDGQHKKTASNARLRALLPGFKFRDTRAGIRDACSWFKANYETARK
jgi:GDP-L-fucose synthase